MTATAVPTLPLEPLVDAVGGVDRLDVDTATLRRWTERGLPRRDGYSLCDQLGIRAGQVWSRALLGRRVPACLFPVGPLMAATGLTSAQLGRWARCSGTVWARVLRYGLTERQADRLACKAGLHPVSVWPRWYELTGTGEVGQ